jgi:membrane-associated protease RseP (regulator of RpoE activity)
VVSILVILTVLALIAVTWAASTVLAGAFVGAVPTRVTLFAGPSVRVMQVRGVEIRLGVLPIGSSVQFLDIDQVEEAYALHEGDENEDPEVAFYRWAARYVGERRLYETLPLVTRLTVHLIGWVPVFLAAQILLGLRPAAIELAEGFSQIFRYFLDKGYAGAATGWLASMVAQGRFAEAGATIAMKVIAVNLLPLPMLAGGQMLIQILSSATGRLLRWPDRMVGVSVAVYFGIMFVFATTVWKLLVR